MRAKPYDDERLGRLLALLRAAPRAWVDRAQRIPFAESELAELLSRKLEADPTFRKGFDADPVGAAEAAGMPDLAARLRRELEDVVRLAERIAREQDPQAALDELLSEAPEVLAHGKQHQRVRTRIRALLLGSEAVRELLRSAARP